MMPVAFLMFLRLVLTVSYQFSAGSILAHQATIADSIPKDANFGMRTRKIPADPRTIYQPVIVAKAPGNEATMVRISDHLVKIFFVNRPGAADKMMSVASVNNGLSWSAPQPEFDLPGQAYYANAVVKDGEGNLHCVFHIYAEGNNGYRGRQLNLWYCRTDKNGKEWSLPKKIFDGYVGSIRGFILLKNHRLLLVFARAVPERVSKPATASVDYGWNEVSALFSDDTGESWQLSKNNISIAIESDQTTRYGAVEPAIIELSNGKVWMLIRTNKGVLYQSYSDDSGKTWQQAEASRFISSDSPATILRLSDHRIILFFCSDQRWDNKRTYALGGRESLHAAISADEGKTWKGFREVLTSPSIKQEEKGDRGTAYPSAIQTADGKVVFVSGQGEVRAIVKFDPDWLEETSQRDDLSGELDKWTLFGAGSSIELVKISPGSLQGLWVRKAGFAKDAVCNFPMTPRGELVMDVKIQPGSKGIMLALSDHFSVSFDSLASENATVYYQLQPGNTNKNSMVNIKVTWDALRGKSDLYINNQLFAEKRFHRPAVFGLNYLRVGIPVRVDDPDGFLITAVQVHGKNL